VASSAAAYPRARVTISPRAHLKVARLARRHEPSSACPDPQAFLQPYVCRPLMPARAAPPPVSQPGRPENAGVSRCRQEMPADKEDNMVTCSTAPSTARVT